MPSFFAVLRSRSNHRSRTGSPTTYHSATTSPLSSPLGFPAPLHPAPSALLSVRIGVRFSMSPLALSYILSAFTGSDAATPRTHGVFSSLSVSAASGFSSGVAPVPRLAVHFRALWLASSPSHRRRLRMSSGYRSRTFMHAKAEATATPNHALHRQMSAQVSRSRSTKDRGISCLLHRGRQTRRRPILRALR